MNSPAFMPHRLPGLADDQRPVHGQRRGQQDRGVDAGDRLRELRARGGPLVAVDHDPDEEVGREERSEEHHLGDDEKQHPEDLRLDAGAAVRRGRAVVLVVVSAWAIDAASTGSGPS